MVTKLKHNQPVLSKDERHLIALAIIDAGKKRGDLYITNLTQLISRIEVLLKRRDLYRVSLNQDNRIVVMLHDLWESEQTGNEWIDTVEFFNTGRVIGCRQGCFEIYIMVYGNKRWYHVDKKRKIEP